jgi:TRAP-type C4-dicarboxylate transport system permease small subunit
MILCGVCLTGFTLATLIDVVTRESGHPLLFLQEATSAFFVYGIFIGTAVATRRNDHLFLSAITEKMTGATRRCFEVFNRAVVCAVGLSMAVFGWQNFLTGFGSFRMPSMWPIAYLYSSFRCAREEGNVLGRADRQRLAVSPASFGDGVLRDPGI